MEYVNLSARVKLEDKQNFEEFCTYAGMNVSVAINLFIKTVLREKRIPFPIEVDPFYSKTNLKALQRSFEQMDNNKTIVKSMSDLKKMENE